MSSHPPNAKEAKMKVKRVELLIERKIALHLPEDHFKSSRYLFFNIPVVSHDC